MGPTWGPPGSCRPKVGPCGPHEPCYLGNHNGTQKREPFECFMECTVHYHIKRNVPCWNIKTVFPGISIINIRRSSDRFIFIMGIPMLVGWELYIETSPICIIPHCLLYSSPYLTRVYVKVWKLCIRNTHKYQPKTLPTNPCDDLSCNSSSSKQMLQVLLSLFG